MDPISCQPNSYGFGNVNIFVILELENGQKTFKMLKVTGLGVKMTFLSNLHDFYQISCHFYHILLI